MRRNAFAFVAGMVVMAGGWAAAPHGHGGGKGPNVKALSAADIVEELGGQKAKATTFEVTFEPARCSAT